MSSHHRNQPPDAPHPPHYPDRPVIDFRVWIVLYALVGVACLVAGVVGRLMR